MTAKEIQTSVTQMASVSPRASGVGFRLFFSWKEYAGPDLQPGLRFKVEVAPGDLKTIRVDLPECPAGISGREFKRILHFAELNKQAINDFWNHKLEDPAFHAALINVSGTSA